MKPSLAIVDYGMGNLRSVQKALQASGAHALVTTSPTVIQNADAVVLPGVGAFGEAVRRLHKGKLWNAVERALARNKPFLGICLGLQLLFDRSEESRGVRGFGFLRGSVVRFRPLKRQPMKVPHMGWNRVHRDVKNKSPWTSSLAKDPYFYFVHSYYPAPSEADVVAATSSYGVEFCAAAAGPTWFASQFHPEKSGIQGLRLLRNFVKRVDRLA